VARIVAWYDSGIDELVEATSPLVASDLNERLKGKIARQLFSSYVLNECPLYLQDILLSATQLSSACCGRLYNVTSKHVMHVNGTEGDMYCVSRSQSPDIAPDRWTREKLRGIHKFRPA
jgi:hypothetical protein